MSDDDEYLSADGGDDGDENALNNADQYEDEPYYAQSEDDRFPTQTSQAQRATERMVAEVLSHVDPNILQQYGRATVQYIKDALLKGLDANFSSLDASRPWLCYWMIHSLVLLGEEIPADLATRVVTTLRMCQHRNGGFGGGYMQMPHTAPTFASTMAILSLGIRDGYQLIRRGPLYRFLYSLKQPSTGAFMVHENGESDSRAMYTVLSVALALNMLTPELCDGCARWIVSAQGFDGGVGGEPGNESHGGYAYCALASLVILRHNHVKSLPIIESFDLGAFSRWLYSRQMQIEGGFQGRTNKLVDSCYSFWQGACFALMNRFDLTLVRPNCDSTRLVQYVLGACTHATGGLKDKPGAHRDFYHTCYALSGLAVVLGMDGQTDKVRLKPTDPIFNVAEHRLASARVYFARMPNTHEELMTLEG